MQELLRNAGRQLEALLTPSSLLQIVLSGSNSRLREDAPSHGRATLFSPRPCLLVRRGNSRAEASDWGMLRAWEDGAHDRAVRRFGVDLEPAVERDQAGCEPTQAGAPGQGPRRPRRRR